MAQVSLSGLNPSRLSDLSITVDKLLADDGMQTRRRWPLLASAMCDVQRNTGHPMIDWMVRDVSGASKRLFNYTQPVRTVISVGPNLARFAGSQVVAQTRTDGLRKHLDEIEQVLWMGEASYDQATHVSTCGGVRYFMSQGVLVDLDKLRLHLQRPTMLVQPPDSDSYEFLTEFSLEVLADLRVLTGTDPRIGFPITAPAPTDQPPEVLADDDAATWYGKTQRYQLARARGRLAA